MKKNFILSMVAAAGMACGMMSCGCDAPQAKLSTDIDSVAYAFGVMQGTQFAAVADSNMLIPGEQIDLNEFLAGFLTAVKRDTTSLKISSQEAETFLRTYFQGVQQREMEKQKAEAEANKATGKSFMDENAKNEGVFTTESGLQYQVITEGKGTKPTATDKVKVNYKGSLLNGTVFDQTEGEPREFRLNGVIKGWTEGMQLMTPGAKYIFWIPSELGYGDRGNQSIPGGSTLKFEVELLEVTPAAKK